MSSTFLEDAVKGLGFRVLKSKAHIDREKFRPISKEVFRLMLDCMGAQAMFWWTDSKWNTDAVAALPDEARELALRAIDSLERGYCISIHYANHPDWPERTFLFLVASRDDENYLYEYPTGEPVPIEALLKKLAEQMEYSTWPNRSTKIYGFMALLIVAVGLFAVNPQPWARYPLTFETKVVFAALCFLVGPAITMLLSWFSCRSHNLEVAKTKRDASNLPAHTTE